MGNRISGINLFPILLWICVVFLAHGLGWASLDSSRLRQLHESWMNHWPGGHAHSFYPIGGYSGWQLGLSLLSPPEGSYLSSHPLSLRTHSPLPRIRLRKGLFYGFDLGLTWIPPIQTATPGYGFWGQVLLLESDEVPLFLVGLLSLDYLQHSTQIHYESSSLGFAIQYSGVNFWYSFGFYQQYHQSKFQGGPDGITLSQYNEKFVSRILRPFVGLGYHLSPNDQVGVELSYMIAWHWILQWSISW